MQAGQGAQGGEGFGDGQGDIDLGQTADSGMADMPIGGGAPQGPQAPVYPSVMLSGGDELSKIPDSGRAMINHSVISRRVHTPQHGKHKGKQRHEVEIHLHSIRPIRGYKKAPSKSKKSDDETAMRKLMGDEEAGEE